MINHYRSLPISILSFEYLRYSKMFSAFKINFFLEPELQLSTNQMLHILNKLNIYKFNLRKHL